MNIAQLSNFYRDIGNWPSSGAALALVAQHVAKLARVSFSSLCLLDGEVKAGYWIEGEKPGASAEGVQYYLSEIQRQADEVLKKTVDPRCDCVDLPVFPELSEEFPWSGTVLLRHFSAVRISGDLHPFLREEVASPQGRHDYGWLIFGSDQEISDEQRVAARVAAERLGSLAEIAVFENGIQLRNQFLSIASHELKTPLTSIYGILQLQERMLRLRKTDPLEVQEERQGSYLALVIRQVKRLNELIDALLNVSRIQVGRFNVEPSQTNVAQLVHEAITGRLEVLAQEASVRLQLDVPAVLEASVDPVRMDEVVTNLVMNAIRFSPEGGMIWIRLRKDQDELRLSVRDQGPSVPLEDRERIFQPFERVQRTGRLGGLGLGLFISRQIARLHGGDVILADSLPGRGNLFEATFSEKIHSQNKAPLGPRISRMRVEKEIQNEHPEDGANLHKA